jgi:hypothetical protein
VHRGRITGDCLIEGNSLPMFPLPTLLSRIFVERYVTIREYVVHGDRELSED